jgi:hypothetical protein
VAVSEPLLVGLDGTIASVLAFETKGQLAPGASDEQQPRIRSSTVRRRVPRFG